MPKNKEDSGGTVNSRGDRLVCVAIILDQPSPSLPLISSLLSISRSEVSLYRNSARGFRLGRSEDGAFLDGSSEANGKALFLIVSSWLIFIFDTNKCLAVSWRYICFFHGITPIRLMGQGKYDWCQDCSNTLQSGQTFTSVFLSRMALTWYRLAMVSQPWWLIRLRMNKNQQSLKNSMGNNGWLSVDISGLRETQLFMACHALHTDKNILQYINKDLAGKHEFPDFHTSIQHV